VGGTETERAYALQVIEAGPWEIETVEAPYFRPVVVEIAQPTRPGENVLGTVYGDGRMVVAAGMDLLLFGEIVAHEWAHLHYFGRSAEFMDAWVAAAGSEADWYVWARSPAEQFAECAKMLWPSSYLYCPTPRTALRWWSAEELWAFMHVYDPAFSDLGHDQELCDAAAGLKEARILRGYDDGTLGASQPVLRRHVALVCRRAAIACSMVAFDYRPASRADVRDAVPQLDWDSERWGEAITRGQLVRLIWREMQGGSDG